MKLEKISPSKLSRLLHCPGSFQLNPKVGYYESSTTYDDKGSAAHSIGEYCLRNNRPTAHGLTFRVVEDKYQEYINKDMFYNIQPYLDYIFGLVNDGWTLHEPEYKLSASVGEYKMYGTADAFLTRDNQGVIVDLKYGRMFVSCESPQLKMYAYMAALHKNLQNVRQVIVQPNAEGDPVRSILMPWSDLRGFVYDLEERITNAKSDNPDFAIGDGCHFCKAKVACPLIEEQEKGITKFMSKDLKSAEINRLVELIQNEALIKKFIEDAKDYLMSQYEKGNVKRDDVYTEVSRANRRWKNEKVTVEELEMYLDEKDILKDPKLKSPAQIEKVLKEKEIDLDIKDLWFKPNGKKKLVVSGVKKVPSDAPKRIKQKTETDDLMDYL